LKTLGKCTTIQKGPPPTRGGGALGLGGEGPRAQEEELDLELGGGGLQADVVWGRGLQALPGGDEPRVREVVQRARAQAPGAEEPPPPNNTPYITALGWGVGPGLGGQPPPHHSMKKCTE